MYNIQLLRFQEVEKIRREEKKKMGDRKDGKRDRENRKQRDTNKCRKEEIKGNRNRKQIRITG